MILYDLIAIGTTLVAVVIMFLILINAIKKDNKELEEFEERKEEEWK